MSDVNFKLSESNLSPTGDKCGYHLGNKMQKSPFV
jgi:hypothetical protein